MNTKNGWRIGNTLFHNNRIIDQNGQAVNLEEHKQLIASAPEMLDLCKQALEHFRLINDPIHVLYAKVVAKAEGRA
jgi:hypothetical protein